MATIFEAYKYQLEKLVQELVSKDRNYIINFESKLAQTPFFVTTLDGIHRFDDCFARFNSISRQAFIWILR